MKVRHIAVYKLHGANQLPDMAESVMLVALSNPTTTAILTTNPEPYFPHIDKWGAIAALSLRWITGLAGLEPPGEQIAAEIEARKALRLQKIGNGIFLVIEGECDIPTPEFKMRRDTEEYAVCFDCNGKSELRARFHPATQRVLTALSLSFSANADRRFMKVDEVIYLIDPDSVKPIYVFNFQGGAVRLSVAGPLTENVIDETVALARGIATDKNMARPARLLSASLDETTDGLQAFIAAWSALEIFVNATFKETYEACWFAIMEAGAPEAGKRVFSRIADVMRDKYRATDKFLIIASMLDSAGAADDADAFIRLKKIRDGLFHALDTPSELLPTESVQKLLFKYMRSASDWRRGPQPSTGVTEAWKT